MRGKYAFYFDSYGAEPDKYVFEYCTLHGLKLGSNNWIIQGMKSTNCGLFCFALILFVRRHKKPLDIPTEFKQDLFEKCNSFINLFVSNGKTNDEILMKYLK